VALADDAEESNVELDRDEQIARIGAKSKALITCCHAIAKDLELHQALPRSGSSCVPRSIGQMINSCRKVFCQPCQAKADPLAHDTELDELHATHVRVTKQAAKATHMFRIEGFGIGGFGKLTTLSCTTHASSGSGLA
jgi:hypothetical protein